MNYNKYKGISQDAYTYCYVASLFVKLYFTYYMLT